MKPNLSQKGDSQNCPFCVGVSVLEGGRGEKGGQDTEIEGDSETATECPESKEPVWTTSDYCFKGAGKERRDS